MNPPPPFRSQSPLIALALCCCLGATAQASAAAAPEADQVDGIVITTRREGGAVRHEITPLGLSLLNGLALTA